MPSRKSPVPTAATSKKNPKSRGPRSAATSADPQHPGMGGGGDRPCRRGGRGLGGFLGTRPECGVGAPRPVRCAAPARPGRGRRGCRHHCRWFACVGVPARTDPAAHSAHLGYHRAPSHPTDSVVRIADRSGRHRGRSRRVGNLDHHRCGRHTRRPSRRCRRGQGSAARDRGRGDSRRADSGVSAPKRHGASAIRAAVRLASIPLGD